MCPDWVHLNLTLQLVYLVGRRSKIPGTDWGTKLNGTNKICIMILKYLKVCDTAGFCLFQRKFYSEFTYYSKRFWTHVIIAKLPCNSFFCNLACSCKLNFIITDCVVLNLMWTFLDRKLCKEWRNNNIVRTHARPVIGRPSCDRTTTAQQQQPVPR